MAYHINPFFTNICIFSLGGGKKGKIRKYFNILIVFIVSGIWHGANWTFIFWGFLHGIANVLNRIFEKKWEKCNVAIRWVLTFLFVNVTWLFFRADSIQQAFELIKRVVSLQGWTISKELIACFHFVETDVLSIILGKYRNVDIYAMAFLYVGAIFLCIRHPSLEQSSSLSIRKALFTSIILVWCLISFSGVSSFLYFNF